MQLSTASPWVNCPNCGQPLTLVSRQECSAQTFVRDDPQYFLVCGNSIVGTWEELLARYGALAQGLEIEMTGQQVEVASTIWPYRPVKADLLEIKCSWSGRLIKLIFSEGHAEAHVSICGFIEVLRDDTLNSAPGKIR